MEIRKSNIKRIHIDAKTGHGDGSFKLELFEPLKPKKISSTWIPQLLGVGGFDTKGDKLLDFWGLTKKEEFNNYYELRGAIAEDLLEVILKKKQYKVKRFHKDDFEYDYFQYNPNSEDKLNKLYKYFSGLPDLVSEKDGIETLYEVKSKEYEKMDKVTTEPPQYEIFQGKVLALLYGLNKVSMVWFFFTDDVIRKMYYATQSSVPFNLKDALKNFNDNYGNLTYNKDYFIYTKEYLFNKKELLDEMISVYKYADGFRQTLTMNISDLSQKMYSQIFRLEGEIEDEFKQKNKRTK